ncbi:CCT domain-containing protein [Cephalotus follicularis]|uniref:CCT domain-containing protein n=1 Tax=Cephalotus follicularis TaxID=3775 RepID=A0A1Q3B830_CEPFO|nr:CCT domain-containing protein [Cephalotus follicularis]
MSSIPQFYSDYPFSSDYSHFSSSTIAEEKCNTSISSGTVSSGAIWGEDKYPTFYDDVGTNIFPQEYCDITSPFPATSFPERLGISNMTVPTLLCPDNNISLCGGIAENYNFGGGFQLQDMCDYGEDCSGFVQDVKKVYPTEFGANWGIQGNQMPASEDTNIKVGRYTAEERKDRIVRYLKKRNQRNFNKTIKYACRKTLADRRVRIRGRFARNNETCEEAMAMRKNGDAQEENELCGGHVVQIKQDEEWLQEAIASLMYIPYISV